MNRAKDEGAGNCLKLQMGAENLLYEILRNHEMNSFWGVLVIFFVKVMLLVSRMRASHPSSILSANCARPNNYAAHPRRALIIKTRLASLVNVIFAWPDNDAKIFLLS